MAQEFEKILKIQTGKQDAIIDAINKGLKEPVFPFYSTGARSLIRVGGKSLGVCTDFQWSVQEAASELKTVDANVPWDIIPGQISIAAKLNNIIDPTSSMETIGLFHTMQSILHAPLIDIQVLDKTGVSVFFARGKFTGVSGNTSKGQMSSISANFQGIMYQHNVYQGYNPYPPDSLLQRAFDAASNYISDTVTKYTSDTEDTAP